MAQSSCQSRKQRGFDSFKPAGYERKRADGPKPPPEPGEKYEAEMHSDMNIKDEENEYMAKLEAEGEG
eukprot:8290005-Alexandrium_andersonii.AAC.1